MRSLSVSVFHSIILLIVNLNRRKRAKLPAHCKTSTISSRLISARINITCRIIARCTLRAGLTCDALLHDVLCPKQKRCNEYNDFNLNLVVNECWI